MPAKSKAQYKFFKWLESNPEERKSRGLSEDEVKDFTKMNKTRFSKLKDRLNSKK